MTLKKIILFLAVIFAISGIVNADDKPVLDIIVPSGNGGNTWAEGNLVRDALIDLGYDSEVIWTRSCFNTKNYYSREQDRPAIFIRSVNRYMRDNNSNCIFETTDDTFIMPFYVRLQAMCVRSEDKFSNFSDFLEGKDRITVATSNNISDDFYDGLSKSTGVEFVRVPYDGGSRVLTGLISGDTDMMYNSYTLREASNDDISCFTTSASKEIDGMVPMVELFPEWEKSNLTYFKYVHAVHVPEERLAEVREIFSTVINEHPKVSKYIKNSFMVPGTEVDSETALDQFASSVENWGGEFNN